MITTYPLPPPLPRGGCDHCEAEQTIKPNAYGPGIHALVITHDANCPWYARATTRQPSRRR